MDEVARESDREWQQEYQGSDRPRRRSSGDTTRCSSRFAVELELSDVASAGNVRFAGDVTPAIIYRTTWKREFEGRERMEEDEDA